MGIPSRHEPVDDRPDDDVPTPTPTQRADPLTAPLAELIADPLTGPLIHPKLAIPAPAAEGADEDAHSAEHDAYVDPVAAPETDEAGSVVEPDEGDPVVDSDEAVDQPDAADPEDEYVDPVAEADPADQQPAPEPTRNDVTVVDVDTEGFEPSAPLDVFAALREPPPAEPVPKKRRALRSTRSGRKRKPTPGQTTPHDDLPEPAADRASEPEPQTRAEPAVASDPPPVTAEVETETIADAAVIGPALAAVLEAHDGTPEVPATSQGAAAQAVAKETPPMTPESDQEALPEHDATDHGTDASDDDAHDADRGATDADASEAATHADADHGATDADARKGAAVADASNDASDEPTGDEPAYETLEELLNAVTARTHPPTPLRPVDDPPATLAWQPASEPAPETPAESITPADDPRRATAAGVARLLAPATAPDAPDKAEPVAAPQAASTPPTAAPETPDAPARTSPVRSAAPRPASEPEPTSAKVSAAAKQPAASSRRADTVDVSARRSTQHLLLVLLLIGLVTTVALAWMAWQEKSPTSIAVAVAAAVVTFIIWNAHSTAAPPQVVVERGMLDIRTHDSHHRFDLASNHTRFDVIGTPGKRGWKVLIHRIGMAPYKLDASMVDPRALTAAMEPYRG